MELEFQVVMSPLPQMEVFGIELIPPQEQYVTFVFQDLLGFKKIFIVFFLRLGVSVYKFIFFN